MPVSRTAPLQMTLNVTLACEGSLNSIYLEEWNTKLECAHRPTGNTMWHAF